MSERFAAMLTVGGRSNALGRTNEVIDAVLDDRRRLEELYGCLSADDAWLRMRAADALEKVCRQHPEWLAPYVDRLLDVAAAGSQPSVQWHVAQMLGEVELTRDQGRRATAWLTRVLSTEQVDWIVAANAMDTLVQLSGSGFLPEADVLPLLGVQRSHRSAAVVRRADRLLARLSSQQ